jgi:hypothetical protein
MKHTHQVFEIITQYFKNKPANVISAKCGDCGEENLKLMELEQERENRIFKACGNRSPYVWWGNDESRLFFKWEDANKLKQDLAESY